MLLGTVVMCTSSTVLLLSRNQVGRLFSNEHGVVTLTAQAVPPLAVSLIGALVACHGVAPCHSASSCAQACIASPAHSQPGPYSNDPLLMHVSMRGVMALQSSLMVFVVFVLLSS